MKNLTSYVSPEELHNRWGLHTESIRRIVREGRLPAVRIGKRLRISLTEVEAFEARNQVLGPKGGVL